MLEPVFVGGANVGMATLHNADEVARKDVRVGDYVVVRRAGDVIPEVVGPVLSRRTEKQVPWAMPGECPRCRAPIVRPEGEKVSRCTGGLACPSRLREWLFHFAGRGGMDIEGLGYKRIDQLLKEGLIKGPADIFFLSAEDLTPLERLAELSVSNLMEGIGGGPGPAGGPIAGGVGHSARGGDGGPVAGPAASGACPPCWRRTRSRWPPLKGWGRSSPSRWREWASDQANRRLVTRLGEGGVRLADPEPEGGMGGPFCWPGCGWSSPELWIR